MYKKLIITALVILAFSFSTMAQSLVGIWQADTEKTKSLLSKDILKKWANADGKTPMFDMIVNEIYYQFKENGTALFRMAKKSQKMNYSYKPNKLYLSYEKDGKDIEKEFEVSFDGDYLILNFLGQNEGLPVIAFKKVNAFPKLFEPTFNEIKNVSKKMLVGTWQGDAKRTKILYSKQHLKNNPELEDFINPYRYTFKNDGTALLELIGTSNGEPFVSSTTKIKYTFHEKTKMLTMNYTEDGKATTKHVKLVFESGHIIMVSKKGYLKLLALKKVK